MSLTSETSKVTARVQVIPAPIASPGKCVICGKHEHDKGFLDPKLDFEFYGTVYFCWDCVADIAGTFNFITPEQAIMLAQRIQNLESDLALHREALLNLEESVEHLTNYRMLRSTIDDTNNSSDVPSATDEASETLDETIDRTVIKFPGTITGSEPEASESGEQQGPNDVPSTTSGDNSSISIIDL